jgi:2,4-dienoyl-CoA reductase-like NADH-dependent reductase (Old Yellow Enzyme family)
VGKTFDAAPRSNEQAPVTRSVRIHVQILANYLYLLPQFFNRTTNRRTDEYGGGIEGRARIMFEVVEGILERVEPSRVGVKISPMHEGGAFAANDETLPMAEFGRPYIANPDLVERLATGAPLAEIDWETVYAAGPRGYSDYPTLQPVSCPGH